MGTGKSIECFVDSMSAMGLVRDMVWHKGGGPSVIIIRNNNLNIFKIKYSPNSLNENIGTGLSGNIDSLFAKNILGLKF